MKLIFILAAVLNGIYRTVLNILNYKSAKNPIPENVSDVYDAENYKKWKSYNAENFRLYAISTLVSLAITISLLATDVYALFAALWPSNISAQIFSVILLESVMRTIVDTVFSYIGTMKIEEKYGFNRSSKKTFVIDKIRGFIVELLISCGMVYALAFIHRSMGDMMIVLFAAVIFVIAMLISFLYPFFSRIGNKFTPLEDGELKDSLTKLLTKYGYKVRAIEVMDASRRTTKLDAYFTSFGKMKTIVLYDNLVNSMTTDEICAVFAHELGHGLHRDVLKNQMLNIIHILIISVTVWFAVRTPEFHHAFGFSEVNYGFAYILLSIALGVIEPLTGIVLNALSRKAEYRADKQAVKEGYGRAMVTSLKKLAKENFANLSPSPFVVFMEYSHPPCNKRIEAVEKACEKYNR